MRRVVIGLRVRTARAVAVSVGRVAGGGIEILDRRELRLHDPALPESAQPFHAGLDLPPADAGLIVERACAAVRRVARKALTSLQRELRARELEPRGVGLVVASLTDPTSIANPHMRAHASEGRLFHEVLLEAAKRAELRSETFLEKEVAEEASRRLAIRSDGLRRELARLGKEIGAPWRKDEKNACLAAWLRLGKR